MILIYLRIAIDAIIRMRLTWNCICTAFMMWLFSVKKKSMNNAYKYFNLHFEFTNSLKKKGKEIHQMN